MAFDPLKEGATELFDPVAEGAVALEEPRRFETFDLPEVFDTPDEAYKKGVKIQDLSADLEMPINDISDNWDLITIPEVVDPATSGMGTGEGRPYPLAETLFVRPWLAAAEAAVPGARRVLLSLADAQLPKAEFTAPSGLADQIENAPWYKKLPEAGGWVAEKAVEYKALGFLFRAVGLSSLFNTLGSKLASRIAGSELAKIGGKQALLRYGGWNTFRVKVLSSIAKTAPENMAFIATWRTTEAARRGEPIGPAAAKGALWGLGFSVAIPLVTEAAKVGMSTATFEKVAIKLQAKYPKLADYLAGKPEQEFIDATIESLKEEAIAAGEPVAGTIVFSQLRPQSQNIIKGLAREYKKAWIKALQKDAAAKRYWATGAKVAEKPPTEPVKPTELAPARRPAVEKVGVKPKEGIKAPPKEFKLRGNERHLIAKMAEQNIKDFSDKELERVFTDVVSPKNAIRGVKTMIERGLTIENVIGVARPAIEKPAKTFRQEFDEYWEWSEGKGYAKPEDLEDAVLEYLADTSEKYQDIEGRFVELDQVGKGRTPEAKKLESQLFAMREETLAKLEAAEPVPAPPKPTAEQIKKLQKATYESEVYHEEQRAAEDTPANFVLRHGFATPTWKAVERGGAVIFESSSKAKFDKHIEENWFEGADYASTFGADMIILKANEPYPDTIEPPWEEYRPAPAAEAVTKGKRIAAEEKAVEARLTEEKTLEGLLSDIKAKVPEGEISRNPVIVEGKKYYPIALPTDQIGVDAEKFQFKLGAKLVGGVTEALKGVEKFDPVKGGQILVWQDKAGKYWVVDGHHRVALAKKTGAESLETWVVSEKDGVTEQDARAIGALRNLADGKGTAVDAAKLFRDSNISLEELRKNAVPTNSVVVQQGLNMADLSDEVFRLVVNERLPANMAATIGKQVKSPAQQKQVADLILEGEVETLRQAELLAATIDSAPVLTKTEQTLFGLETTEKSLYAERAKVLANVEKKLKTNKKVFGVLATQTGIIEAKGNILAKVENLATKEKAEEVLFMLEKLANSKGPVAEALNDATKQYAENPTKENLSKATNELLEKWTEGPGRLRVPVGKEVSGLPLERAAEKVKAKEGMIEREIWGTKEFNEGKQAAIKWGDKAGTAENPYSEGSVAWGAWNRGWNSYELKPKGKPGFIDVTPLEVAHKTFMNIIEPSKEVEIKLGKDVYAEVIKGTHKADVAMIEFNEQEIDNLDSSLSEIGKELGKYPKRILELLMLTRGKPFSAEAIALQQDAMIALKKEAPELVGTRRMIKKVADFNYQYLQDVVGDEINNVEDYFYGVYKNPRKVERFLDHWKTTKRFTKEKKLPTVADAKAYGLELRHVNPIDNLRSEYLAIARLDGMIELKESLMKTGKGKYIEEWLEAPPEWEKIHDPVFSGVGATPELAKMINNLISTNKISRQPVLNTLRHINNFLRQVKFAGSAFHLGVEAKQAIADSGYLGFLHKKTAVGGVTTGFKKGDPIFRQEWYKKYVNLGGGHRYSIDSEAQRQLSNMISKLNELGTAIKIVAFPITIPERFVRWMFQNYIPKVKAMKYLDVVAEQEKKLGRSLTDAEHIEIIKEGQNFYGMMNERLFGRSGTVTTVLRFKFMAPGFAEGNYRTMLKAILQWGGNKGFKAHRSRSNIINSFIVSAALATLGTLILTGKPPKAPEKLADIRDLFKIDTGKVDQHGRRIMIDLLTYDKDYWGVFGNIATGQPVKAVSETIRRLGGMTATTWDVVSDLNQMSMGRAIYDWKADRVTEVTDSFIRKVLKLSMHELKKAEPISTNVFAQARQKDVGPTLAAAMTLMGVRLTKSEKDKREIKVLSEIFSLRDQQERLYYYLGTLKNPREHIKAYNQTVMRILNSSITPLEFKDEYEPKLIIDEKRLISNKVYGYLGDQTKLAELSRKPEKYAKDIKKLREDIQKAEQWLKNFEIDKSQHKKHLIVHELYHRKLLKEPDIPDELKNDLAKFYAEQTTLRRKLRADAIKDEEKRLLKKYDALAQNISEVSRRLYDTEDVERRERYYNSIERAVGRMD